MTGLILRTARLTLIPHAPADLEEMAAMLGDADVMAHIGSGPATREESWRRLLRYIGHWQAVGYGHWVVRDAGTGAFLGEVGLMDSRRASDPGFEGVAEAAWVFNRAAHGQGYAREATEAMLEWADAHCIDSTVCIIAPANAPSIRLAERLGYGSAGEAVYRDAPILLLKRARQRSGSSVASPA